MSSRLGQIHDVAEVLAEGAGAISNLAALRGGREVGAHTHANAYLQLYVLGGYRECGEGGEAVIDGPAASFFPAGSAHEMRVAPDGLATVIVEFDPARLRCIVGEERRLARVRHWIGGDVGARASALGRLWLSGGPCAFAATAAFLRSALEDAPEPRVAPRWIGGLEADMAEGAPRLDRLATRFGVSRPWLARAYRAWRGEGLGQTLRRRRVAAAAQMMERAEL
ncbi:MAG TPA: hypothetical protein VMT68_16030, partial [Caulobacteraceae bacterium]|nr:hypothetical protein [Caulobacteraceae bacterium]